MAGIAVGGVAAMGVLGGEKERIVASGDDDQVDVVGHEAITGQREAMDGAVVAEEVDRPVGRSRIRKRHGGHSLFG